jgi:hypothetical protein
LETQLEVVPFLLHGASDEVVHRRSESGQWSAHENLAHLGRHHEVMLERLDRVLTEPNPELGRYRAESDPNWPAWSGLTTEDVIVRVRLLRTRLLELIAGLSNEELTRSGIHPLLGEMSIPEWLEFFLLHEAHHLYTIMLRLGEARRAFQIEEAP